MKPLRTLISPVVIAAIAVAGLSAAPAPARAETNDLTKLLIGLGAIAIIAKAAENNRDSDSNVVTTTRSDRIVTIPERRTKKKHRKYSYALPKNCLRVYEARKGDRKLYSGRCLDRLPYRLAKLPERCAFTVMGRHDVRGKAYGPRCMAKHGFYQVSGSKSDRRGSRHIVYRK